jgi:hypothetical protein
LLRDINGDIHEIVIRDIDLQRSGLAVGVAREVHPARTRRGSDTLARQDWQRGSLAILANHNDLGPHMTALHLPLRLPWQCHQQREARGWDHQKIAHPH